MDTINGLSSQNQSRSFFYLCIGEYVSQKSAENSEGLERIAGYADNNLAEYILRKCSNESYTDLVKRIGHGGRFGLEFDFGDITQGFELWYNAYIQDFFKFCQDSCTESVRHGIGRCYEKYPLTKIIELRNSDNLEWLAFFDISMAYCLEQIDENESIALIDSIKGTIFIN